MTEELETLLNNSEIYLEVYTENKVPVYLRIKEVKDDTKESFTYEHRRYVLEVATNVDFSKSTPSSRSPRMPLEFSQLFRAAVDYTGAAKEIEERTAKGNVEYPAVLIRHNAWAQIKYESIEQIAPKLFESKHQGTYTVNALFKQTV